MIQPLSHERSGRSRPALRLVDTRKIERADWLQVRKSGIGGSDAAAAVGLNPHKSALALWMEKTGREGELRYPDPTDTREPIYWGNLLEPIVAAAYTAQTGNKVRKVNAVLRHPTVPYMLANLDREIVGNPGVQILECKTAGEFGSRLWKEGVPEYVQLQVQHQLAVTGKQAADVAVLLCGQKLEVHRIERDEALIAHLIELEGHFWRYVTEDKPPPPDGSVSADQALRALYPRDQGQTLDWSATGHVGFFLSLHKEAGTQRAEAIKMDSTLTNPNRPLTQVRKEQERVQNTLVRAESISCADDCAVHRLKITQLRNRAKVLDAEENEYLRWQNANDRLDIRRDAAREDPVMTILADWFGVTAERFSMIMGLLFTMILEGVGALCWIEVARRRDSTAGLAVTNPVTNADTRPDTSALKSTESAALQTSRTKKENDLDQKITKVREAIAASQIRPTVNEIMRFLRCGRAKACKVRTAVAQA